MYGFCKDKLTGEVGGHFLIWLLLVCTAEQGMIFRVLSLKQGVLTFSLFGVLNKVPFWTDRSLFKECKGWR